MNPSNVQVLFFQHLKAQLPPHLSMVDEVAGLLGISNDSAYRRIRGEKPMDLEETHKLCSHFKISMDQLLHLRNDAFIFTGNLNNNGGSIAFEDWLQNVLYNLHMVNSFQKRHLYYLLKDIPPFVNFLIPELAAFKCFSWMKSILNDEQLKGVKFSLADKRYDKYVSSCKQIIQLYNQVPTTEIWHPESHNILLSQINFCVEAGFFQNKDDIKILHEKVEELINHIEKQAELGVKFNVGEKPARDAASYRMFVNELVLGDNTVIAELGETRVTYLNHGVLYFVVTQDERFNKVAFEHMENLIKRSTMISTIGEKERIRFFNRLRDNIQSRMSAFA